MSLARFTPTDLLAAVGRLPTGRKGRYPTPKQVAVFRDRDLPLPRTRGEASEILSVMAKAEGWKRKGEHDDH